MATRTAKPKDTDPMSVAARLAALRKSLPERERRIIPLELGPVELRQEGDDPPRIRMFIPFDSPSQLIFGFTERIAPGAFARTIKNGAADRRGGDIVALWNHDPNWVLGRQGNKSLTLRETDDGLEGEVMLDSNNRMHDVFAAQVDRRDVQGASFGFETVKDEWRYDEDGSAERTLKEVKLFDVSPVTFPAYPESDAERRSMGLAVATVRAGVDLGVLAGLLAEVRDGKIAQTAVPELRGLLARLHALIPPPPAPPVDWARKLDLRERSCP